MKSKITTGMLYQKWKIRLKVTGGITGCVKEMNNLILDDNKKLRIDSKIYILR